VRFPRRARRVRSRPRWKRSGPPAADAPHRGDPPQRFRDREPEVRRTLTEQKQSGRRGLGRRPEVVVRDGDLWDLAVAARRQVENGAVRREAQRLREVDLPSRTRGLGSLRSPVPLHAGSFRSGKACRPAERVGSRGERRWGRAPERRARLFAPGGSHGSGFRNAGPGASACCNGVEGTSLRPSPSASGSNAPNRSCTRATSRAPLVPHPSRP